VTYDLAEAREWFDLLPAAMGVEGLVLKPTAARYAGGSRSSWAKVNSVGVRRVRFARAADVVPAQHAARRSPIVRDRCCGRVVA
jgi:ATP-dependent DNA ligase